MKSTETMIRFLLPCTTEVDRAAIDAAVELAYSCGAALVPLSLHNALRREDVKATQPSKHDFLELVQHQAAVMEVPVEWFAISTHDPGRSIHVFAEEMDCAGILLFTREGQGILLENNEVQYVIKHEHIILPFLIHLQPEKRTLFVVARPSYQRKGIPQRKKAFPLWYPFALLGLILIVAALVFLNAMYFFREPAFTLASLLVKLIFICVITLSLTTILTFSLDLWRKKGRQRK